MTNILLAFLLLFLGIVAVVLTKLLKNSTSTAENDARKFFHILIFTAAGLIYFYWDIIPLFIFGMIITGSVIYAVIFRRRSNFYHALKRDSDHPRSTFYVLLPLISTALGGIVSVLLYGKFALVGFWVTGWGDGAAEIVGSRWGKNRYSTFLTGKETTAKSFEGSMAMFIMGSIAACSALFLLKIPFPAAVFIGISSAFASTVFEGISLRGTDNLAVQIIASGTASLLYYKILIKFF